MSTFTYFGQEFAYAEEFPAFAFAEFQEAMDDDEEAGSGRAMGVALRLAVGCVAENDRARFRRLSRQHNAKVEDWLRVFRDYTSEEAERPTGRPADSSGGPGTTVQSSGSEPVASVSSLPETVRPIRADMALALSRTA